MFRRLITIWLCVFYIFSLYAQDIGQAKKVVSDLCSENMYGRGYVDLGHLKAATYISIKFKELGLKGKTNLQGELFQEFMLPINKFPGYLSLEINKERVEPGKDYIMAPYSSGGRGRARIEHLDTTIFTDPEKAKEFLKDKFKRKALVYDDKWHGPLMDMGLEYIEQLYSAEAIIKLQEHKLTAALSQDQYSPPLFEMKKSAFPADAKKIKYDVTAQKRMIKTQNVIGYVEGTEQPDSFMIFCAHYDHLGGQGQIYFPGANDNAAGIAMLFQLAEYYTANPPKHSVMFIAFGGEEAGLVGSSFYVDHPYFPLESIKFVMNLDLVATGSKGAMVVNGKVFEAHYELLNDINDEKGYFSVIKKRGPAANSDHYYFSEEGVPAFFIYLMGDEVTAYHDVNDVPENLPYTRFKELIHLLIDFNERLSK